MSLRRPVVLYTSSIFYDPEESIAVQLKVQAQWGLNSQKLTLVMRQPKHAKTCVSRPAHYYVLFSLVWTLHKFKQDEENFV